MSGADVTAIGLVVTLLVFFAAAAPAGIIAPQFIGGADGFRFAVLHGAGTDGLHLPLDWLALDDVHVCAEDVLHGLPTDHHARFAERLDAVLDVKVMIGGELARRQAVVTVHAEHQIGTVYAWVSWLKEDMTWGGRRDGTDEFTEVQPDVMAFVEAFKELYPESILYGWVSMPANIHDMSDADVRTEVAEFSERVIREMNFDGVFLNIEPVWNNDTSFINLLRDVREAVGEDVLLSAAIKTAGATRAHNLITRTAAGVPHARSCWC